MIRFSALLVAVATGLLIAGVVTSKLALVYVAIGISALALVALAAGASLKRHELFGQPGETLSSARSARPEAISVSAGGTPIGSAWGAEESSSGQASAWSPFEQAGSFPASAAWPATSGPVTSGPVTSGPAASAPVAGAATRRTGTGWSGSVESPAGAERWTGLPEAGRVDTGLAAFAPPAHPVEQPPPAEPVSHDRGIPDPAQTPAAATASPQSDITVAVPPLPAATDAEPTAKTATAQPGEGEGASADPAASVTEGREGPADDTSVDAAATKPDDATSAAIGADSAGSPAQTPGDPDGAGVTTALNESSPDETSADEGAASSARDAEAEPTLVADPMQEVTVVPGVPRYHNAGCILIRFMSVDDLEKMTLAAAQKVGCTPCRACLPDQETD